MIPKQDRIKPRTVEDLERKYNFTNMEGTASNSYRAATEAMNAAKQAEASASGKVSKTDYDEVVKMLNHSTEKVILDANRLVVNSKNFKLTEDGDVTMKSANKKGYAYSVTVDDGILTVDSPYKIQGEGFQQVIELMRFHIRGELYRLCLLVGLPENATDGKWVLINRFIEPVPQQEEEQEQI